LHHGIQFRAKKIRDSGQIVSIDSRTFYFKNRLSKLETGSAKWFELFYMVINGFMAMIFYLSPSKDSKPDCHPVLNE